MSMQDWAHFAGLQSAAAEQQDPGKALSWVHFQTHLWQRFFAIQLELPAAERAAQAALAQLPAAERLAEGAGSGAASQAETPTPVELTAVLMPVEAAESSVVVGLPSAVDVCRTGSALCIHVDAACLAQTSPAGLVQKTASDAIRCNQHMWSSCALVQQALWHL